MLEFLDGFDPCKLVHGAMRFESVFGAWRTEVRRWKMLAFRKSRSRLRADVREAKEQRRKPLQGRLDAFCVDG